MSKAFTRESDEDDSEPLPRPVTPLPPGAKNYLTPDGERALREEIEALMARRQKLDAADAEAKRPLQTLNQRIAYLSQSLQTAVVVPAPPPPWNQVRFGATVTVRDTKGNEDSYRIVGVDETDMDRGWVSFLSPIARALLNANLGQRVKFRFPSGEEQLEVTAIRYEAS